MILKKIRFVAQVIGFVCIGLLAVYGGVVAATGALPSWASEMSAANDMTPAYISYQGTLRDTDDNPANGTYNLVVKIYADAGATGSALWQETHNSVEVREGRFNLLLGEGSAIPDDLFSSPDRYVQLTVNSTPMAPTQRFASVPYAFQAGNGVPVGAVIDWWRPDTLLPVPDGYMICDGSTVTDLQSPLYNKTLPDLTDKFVRGVTDVNDIGTTGGELNHDHTINHDHPNANNSGTADSGGEHNHAWARQVNNDWYSYYANGTDWYLINWGDGMDTEGSGHYPLAYNGTHTYYTTKNGDHTHTVDVNLPNYTGNSGGRDLIPPYVGLLKLCRIK